MGWFGPRAQLDYALRLAGADRDEEGRLLVSGTIALGIGGEEIAVADDARFYCDGRPRSIPALLNATSYGLRDVMVIAADPPEATRV